LTRAEPSHFASRLTNFRRDYDRTFWPLQAQSPVRYQSRSSSAIDPSPQGTGIQPIAKRYLHPVRRPYPTVY
jgi:hypothetical protein